MSVAVTPVRSSADLNAFVDLPWHIYHDDPYWVPPLRRDVKRKLDRSRCLFFEHGEAEFFLARRGGQTVGRIAAIKNDIHLRVHNEPIGYFGFFESFNDHSVAAALFSAAADWLRARNLEVMRGPINYSTNEDCGLLVEPFDRLPAIMMPHNRPYYVALIEAFGFRKAKDLLAYEATEDTRIPERVPQLAELVKERTDLKVRPFDSRQTRRDVAIIKELYHSVLVGLWGFTPLTDREFDHMARELLRIGDPELVSIAELAGEPVGFLLLLPDWNQALRHANGRLFPLGWARLWWHSHRIDTLRGVAFGVTAACRKQGVDLLLGYEAYKVGISKGYRRIELSWILEDLVPHIRAIENIGARRSKRYRIYDLPLAMSPAGSPPSAC